MALCLGLFGTRDDETVSPAPSRSHSWDLLPWPLANCGFYSRRPQPGHDSPLPGYRYIWFQFQWWLREVITVGAGKGWVLFAVLWPAGAVEGGSDTERLAVDVLHLRLLHLLWACCTGKRLAGWAPMGGAILGYMAVSGDWKLFLRVDVPTGLLIVLMTGHPWISRC